MNQTIHPRTQVPQPLPNTPKIDEYLKRYRMNLPEEFNVVEKGGWYAIEKEALVKLGQESLDKIRSNLPKDFVTTDADNSYDDETLQLLSIDPKGFLTQLVQSLQQQQQKKKRKQSIDANDSSDAALTAYLDSIMALLSAQGKGYEGDLVDGDWILVLQRQGRRSPSVQKLVGRGETLGRSVSTFDVKHLQFHGQVKLAKGLLTVSSTVQYMPSTQPYDIVNGKIVLRRIGCDIIRAGIRPKFLPRIGLPFLRRKGGYLDFIYLDRDLRITRGNRGGLFIHARPEFARQLSASSSS
jgi:hypothetical protein